MQDTTRTALTAILAADPTVSRPAATRALSILDGADAPHPMGRILRTTEAARLCGVTTKTLRAWSKAGVLVPVYAGQNKLRTGYTEASVRAVLEGNSKRTEGAA